MDPEGLDLEAEALPDFKEADFYLEMDQVELGPKIGAGHFSTVFLARYFGDLVAVKKQLREERTMDRYLLRELSVLKYISHPNLLVYIGAQNVQESERHAMEHKFTLYIVTELARGGDFLQMVMKPDTPISWPWRVHMLRDAADALAYLHENHLIHRDLKGANLLLDVSADGKWTCKLSDFGMTRPLAQVEEKRRLTICGTEDYMAPELLFDEEYGAAADVFSFGMVMLEALAREGVGNSGSSGNYARRTPANKFALDIERLRARFTNDAPESLVLLAQSCICYEMEERITAQDAKEWLEGLIEDNFGGLAAPYLCPPIPDLPIFGHPQEERVSTVSMASMAEPRESVVPTEEGSFVERDGERVAVLRRGFLFKRNRHGFRNWKKRWFVLTDKELMWYTRKGDPRPKGILTLLNCRIVKTKAYRWSILDTADQSRVTDGRLHNRELAADGRRSMRTWTNHIQEVIDALNQDTFGTREVQTPTTARARGETLAKEAAAALQNAAAAADKAATTHDVDDQKMAAELAATAAQKAARAAVVRRALSNKDLTAEAPAREGNGRRLSDMRHLSSTTTYGSLEDWLGLHNLRDLLENLTDTGITTLAQLGDMHLQTDEDCAVLGIELAQRRRALVEAVATSGLGSGQPKLLIECDGWREFGDVRAYRFSAVYGLTKSQIYLRYSDFLKLDRQLRNVLTQQLQDALPALPRSNTHHDQLNLAYVMDRKERLLAYLQGVAGMAERVPGDALAVILTFLRLVDSTNSGRSKATSDIVRNSGIAML